MSSAGMIDHSRNLLAGVPWRVNTTDANYVAIIKAPAGALSMRFDDRQGIERYEGMGCPVPRFSKLEVTSNVDQAVVISVGYVESGAPYDARPVQFFGSIDVNTDVPDTNETQPDLILAAGDTDPVVNVDPERKTLVLQLDEDAVGPVRYGDSNVGPARGLKLYPGDTLSIDGTAPVFVHNPNASSVELHILVQER